MKNRGIAPTTFRLSVTVLLVVILTSLVTLCWGSAPRRASAKLPVLGPSGRTTTFNRAAAAHYSFTAKPKTPDTSLTAQMAKRNLAIRRTTRQDLPAAVITPGFVNLTYSPAHERYPAWGPDGETIAFTADGIDSDGDGRIDTAVDQRCLFTMKWDGSQLKQYKLPSGNVLGLAWHPTGNQIYVVVNDNGAYSIRWYDVSTPTALNDTVVYTTASPIESLVMAPNGTMVFFDMKDATGKWNIFQIASQLPANTQPVLKQLTGDPTPADPNGYDKLGAGSDNKRPTIANLGRIMLFQSNRVDPAQNQNGHWRICQMVLDQQTVTMLTNPADVDADDTEPQATAPDATTGFSSSFIVFASTRLIPGTSDAFADSNIWRMAYRPDDANPQEPNDPFDANAAKTSYFSDPANKTKQIDPFPNPMSGRRNDMVFVSDFDGVSAITDDVMLGVINDTQAPYITSPVVTTSATADEPKICNPGDVVKVTVPVVDLNTGVRKVWLQLKDPDPATLDSQGINRIILGTHYRGTQVVDAVTKLNYDLSLIGGGGGGGGGGPLFPPWFDYTFTNAAPIEFSLWDPVAYDYAANPTDYTNHPGYYAAAGPVPLPSDATDSPQLFYDLFDSSEAGTEFSWEKASPNSTVKLDDLGYPNDVGVWGKNGFLEGYGYPAVSPYWIPLYDDGTHGDDTANDGSWTCNLTTPKYASDWYFDIIVEDKNNVAYDPVAGEWHGSRRRFDNVGGCTTNRYFTGGKRILLVDDYMDGQRFLATGLPPVSVPYQSPAYINSYYYFNEEQSTTLEPDATKTTAYYSPFIAKGEFGGADVWRILCRGPVPDYILNSYLPSQVTQIDPTDSNYRLTKTAVHGEKVVAWVSPFPQYHFLAPMPNSPTLSAAARTGSILAREVQQSLTNFVNAGGRLFVIGPDLASGLHHQVTTVGSGTGDEFMANILGVTVNETDPGDQQSSVNTGPWWLSTPGQHHATFLPGLVAAPNNVNLPDTSARQAGVKWVGMWYGSDLSYSRWGPGNYHAAGTANMIGYEHFVDYGGDIDKGVYTIGHDHWVLPLNGNPAKYGYYTPDYGNSAFADGKLCWDRLTPAVGTRVAFLCWDADGASIAGHDKPGATSIVVGVSKEQPNGGRTVFWSFDYADLSAAYRPRPAGDTIEWLFDGSISGTVAQINGMLPIPDAIIILYNGNNPIAATRTDAQGRYLIRGVRPGHNYTIKVMRNGFYGTDTHAVWVRGGKVTDENTPQNDGGETTFFLYRDITVASVYGDVKLNGVLVVGAKVTATALSGTPPATATTVTDAAGHYEIKNLQSGPYKISAVHPTIPTDVATIMLNDTNGNMKLSDGEDRHVDLAFVPAGPPPGKMTGTVYQTGTTTPIVGATVTLQNAGATVATVVTDTNGNFTIDNLTTGTYTLSVTATGYITPQPLTITFNQVTGALLDPIYMDPIGVSGSGQLYLRVYQGNTQNPLDGVKVTTLINGVEYSSKLTANVFTSGTIKSNVDFDLPANSYLIRLTKAGYRTVERSLTITANQVISNIDITMMPLMIISQGKSMISFPGMYPKAGAAVNEDLLTILGDGTTPANIPDLQLAVYNPAQPSNPYTIYGAADIPNVPINPGAGYWVKLANTASLTQDSTPVTTDANGYYSISLTRGWNLIGNPFTVAVDLYDCQVVAGVTETWNTAVTAGTVGDSVYTWNGQEYAPVTIMQPYLGFWLYAGSSCTMNFYNRAAVRSAAATRVRRTPTANEWRVQLRAQAGTLRDSANAFGVSSTARDGYTPCQDLLEPPAAPGDSVVLTFPHRAWGDHAGDYTQEIQGNSAGDKHWDFTVATTLANTDVVLSWPELAAQLPSGYQAMLKDLTSGQSCYLNTTSQYTFKSGSGGTNRAFEIVVSTRTTPLQVTNIRSTGATRGEAGINFTLTEEAQVTIVIRNQAGRLVRTIATGLPATLGVNTVSWDRRDNAGNLVPRGSYLCQISAGDATGRAARGTGLLMLLPVP